METRDRLLFQIDTWYRELNTFWMLILLPFYIMVLIMFMPEDDFDKFIISCEKFKQFENI